MKPKKVVEKPYPSANMKLVFLLFIIISVCAIGIIVGAVSLFDGSNEIIVNDNDSFVSIDDLIDTIISNQTIANESMNTSVVEDVNLTVPSAEVQNLTNESILE